MFRTLFCSPRPAMAQVRDVEPSPELRGEGSILTIASPAPEIGSCVRTPPPHLACDLARCASAPDDGVVGSLRILSATITKLHKIHRLSFAESVACMRSLFSINLRFSLGWGQMDPKRFGETKTRSALPIYGARVIRRGEPLHQGTGDGNSRQADQVGGDTRVRASTQGEVSRIAAREIELVRMREALGVAVCRNYPQDDAFAAANQGAIEIDVRRGLPGENPNKTGVAQQLLDRLLYQFRLSMQQIPLLRKSHQGEPRISQYAGHGLRDRNESGFAQGLWSGRKVIPKLGAGAIRAAAQSRVIRFGGSGRYSPGPFAETFGIASGDACHHCSQ